MSDFPVPSQKILLKDKYMLNMDPKPNLFTNIVAGGTCPASIT